MPDAQLAFPETRDLTGQNAKVLDMLRAQEWTCGTEFLRAYLPRFGARLWDLKRLGYVTEKKRCENVRHGHVSVQWAWKLAVEGGKKDANN